MVIIVIPRESGVSSNPERYGDTTTVVPAKAGTHNHRICRESECFNVSSQIALTVCMGPRLRGDDEVLMARDKLWNALAWIDRLRPPHQRKSALSKSASRARLAEIIRKRSFGRGEITLASGRKSDFYFNLKPTMLDPEGAALLAELSFEALKDDNLDYIGGLEMGAVPIAGSIAQLSWLKGHPIAAFFVRKKPKEHGARLAVEGLAKGETLQGKRVVIVEDVTTTGGSAIKAADAVRDAGGEIALVFTMVDREEGATENFAEAGLVFRSLYRASEFLKG
jgi:orotate phosphoribosyltransferase